MTTTDVDELHAIFHYAIYFAFDQYGQMVAEHQSKLTKHACTLEEFREWQSQYGVVTQGEGSNLVMWPDENTENNQLIAKMRWC